MRREERILQYLVQALTLLRAGHRDHLPILGRLDNAAIAASIGGWKELREAIGVAEEHFLLGSYKAAERALLSAVECAELHLGRKTEGTGADE